MRVKWFSLIIFALVASLILQAIPQTQSWVFAYGAFVGMLAKYFVEKKEQNNG